MDEQKARELIDDVFSPENSIFKRKKVQLNEEAQQRIRKDQGFIDTSPDYFQDF